MNDYYQGLNSGQVFSGNGKSKASQEIYGESVQLFSSIIKERLSPGVYRVADFGSSKGEMVSEIKKILSDYSFETYSIDSNGEDLEKNTLSDHKVVSDISDENFEIQKFDICIMRYVLQWNSLQKQKRILKNFTDSIGKFGVIQHSGADVLCEDEWRDKVSGLFKGEIQQLKRDNMYFSSSREIEQILNNSNYIKVDEKRIDNLSDVYIEKYNLEESEANKVKSILSGKDYVIRTTWIVLSN